MITISNLSKSYGVQHLFEQASLVISPGERVGLVGRNGHGKSTLFRMILEQEPYDDGEITLQKGARVGHLEQHLSFRSKTVHEEACSTLPVIDGYREEFKAEKILTGLGFAESDFNRSPDTFSGGFQIRIQLAKLLVSEPDVLLLDEPTNYLDIVSIRWLESFLVTSNATLLLITHDRRFMDKIVTHTALIHRLKIRKIRGDTSKIYDQIAEEEEIYQRTVQNQQKKRNETLQFIDRFRAKASKAKQVQSRVKALEREGELQELSDIEELDFSFSSLPFQGKRLGVVEDLSFGYSTENLLIKNLTLSINPKDRIAVIGPNGKGKSTLLELLAGERAPLSGNLSYHPDCVIGYFGQTNIGRLNPAMTIEQEILQSMPQQNRSRARAICGAMMFSGDLALKETKVLSGGEKARVMLGKLLATPSNLLLLDEPLNHLDMYSVEALIEAIEAYSGAVIFVAHDEDLVERVAERLIIFDRGKVELFEGTYNSFLKKIGWSEEIGSNEAPSSSHSSIGKKELRKLRAEINQERSKELRPLERVVQKLENEIMEREEEIEKLQTELLEITKDGLGDNAVKISRLLTQHKEAIDELFVELEENERILSARREQFDLRLRELES